MDRPQIIEQVGHFLRNELPIEETTKVKDLIANNKDYSDVYNELKGLQLSLRAEDLGNKLDLLKGLEIDSANNSQADLDLKSAESPTGSRLLKALLGLVTGLAIVYGLGYLTNSDQQTIKQKLPQMAENIGQYVVHQQVRSTSSDLTKDQERAYNLFVIQQFDQAIPLLERLWEKDQDETGYYYLGIAYWYRGEEEKAREILSNKLFNDYKKPF